MISVALKQVGKRYSLGKNGPDLFDCSGLAYYCLQAVNVYCRRLSAAGFSQMTSWTKINSMGSIKKGDLLFYKSDDSSSVGHVAIYIGGGMMVDASSSNGKVMKRSCTGTWCRRNFVFARRPIT
jgi:cell wall-associated NlpC family hydrolase